MLLVSIPHTIAQDAGVAVAQLVVFGYKILLVLCPALGRKLLRFEEVAQLSCLMDLGKSSLAEKATLDLAGWQLLVAMDIDGADLQFLVFIYLDVEDNVVLVDHILALADVDFSVLIALVIEILLGDELRAVDHVGRNLSTLEQSEGVFEVGLLALLHTTIIDGGDTGARLEVDMQIDVVANDRVGCDRDVREESVFPIALHGIRDGIARNLDLLPDLQTGDIREHIVLVAFHT